MFPHTDKLDRCDICGWRLADEEDHRAVEDPRGELEKPICEHCAACRTPK